MPRDARGWDERYRSEGSPVGAEPAAFLRDVLPLLPRGRALDLAMGAGRNAVFLASNAWQVTGVDYSKVALEKAASLAREHGLSIHWAAELQHELPARRVGLLLVEADLECGNFPPGQFELVVCFYYLQRSLFPLIERALAPGGMVVYETYTLDRPASAGGPRNPEYLLCQHELLGAFVSLETVFYRELQAGKGIASLLARKPKTVSLSRPWTRA
ncbi:MAG TPA: class I SAM-dependent methyltransferase [Candidatus Acidoferrales bacterium]|nr:class I SAM-dependent methyltransferase [Candidatus Acidoferrales bacterium]